MLGRLLPGIGFELIGFQRSRVLGMDLNWTRHFRTAALGDDRVGAEEAEMTVEPTSGERFEKVAFQFCKIATVALICGRFTLPVAATLATGLYIAAFVKGKHDTRCILRYPLLIAAFWGMVATLAWIYTINPNVLSAIRLGK
jgi:hypothetical protein